MCVLEALLRFQPADGVVNCYLLLRDRVDGKLQKSDLHPALFFLPLLSFLPGVLCETYIAGSSIGAF